MDIYTAYTKSKLLRDILDIGFLTGSRAFGTNRPNSDYDIIFSIDDTDKIESLISGHKRERSNYFTGFFIYDCDLNNNINLIPVHCHEYRAWVLATYSLKDTIKLSKIDNKIKIHSLFLALVSIFKGLIEEHKNIDKYKIENKDLIKEIQKLYYDTEDGKK